MILLFQLPFRQGFFRRKKESILLFKWQPEELKYFWIFLWFFLIWNLDSAKRVDNFNPLCLSTVHRKKGQLSPWSTEGQMRSGCCQPMLIPEEISGSGWEWPSRALAVAGSIYTGAGWQVHVTSCNSLSSSPLPFSAWQPTVQNGTAMSGTWRAFTAIMANI